MAGRIAAYLVACRNFMAICMLLSFLFAAVYLITLKWFRWNGRSIRLFGLFYGLNRRGLLAISMWYVRMIYLAVFLLQRQALDRFSMVMILISGGLAGGLSGRVLGMLRELANSTLIIAGLLVGNLLVTYMKDIQFDWSIAAVYGLLSVFILLYCMYFMVRDIRSISKGRKESDVEQDLEEKME